MKKLTLLALLASVFFFSQCSKGELQNETKDLKVNSLGLEGQGDSNLDEIIFAYVKFQDQLVALDHDHLHLTIDEINRAIDAENYSRAADLLYNDLEIKEAEVNNLFSLINEYVSEYSSANLHEKIEVRMEFLLCDGQLPSYPLTLCDESQSRWWGGKCGLRRHLFAVGAGVTALASVATAIGTGGASTAIAVIAVAGAAHQIGGIAKDCS